jgi:glycosyltransferase involved in cell wall biosynthesis
MIPVYNGANYLSQAIESALAQTWPNIEVLVVDDGSDDDGRTEAVAKVYGDRIRYVKKPNGGVATALNRGIELMRSEYFSWLSHDDRFEPSKIDRMMRVVLGRPDTVIAFGDFVATDEDGRFVREYRTGDRFDERKPLWAVFEGRINGCAMLIPKRCFDICGLFDPRLPATQDYDMWFRMALRFPFVHVPGTAVFQRDHADQGSKSARFMDEVQLLWVSMLDRLSRKLILAHAPSEAAFFERVSRHIAHLRGVCTNVLERMYPQRSFPIAAILLWELAPLDALAHAITLLEAGFTHVISVRKDEDEWRSISVEEESGSRIKVDSLHVLTDSPSACEVGVLASLVTEEFIWVTTRSGFGNLNLVPSQLSLLTDDPSAVVCLIADPQHGVPPHELGVLEGAVFRTAALRAACDASIGTVTSIVHALSRLGAIVSKIVPPSSAAPDVEVLSLPVDCGVVDASEQVAGPAPILSPGIGVRAWAFINRWPRAAAVVTRAAWSLLGGNATASKRLLNWNGLADAMDIEWYRTKYADVATTGMDPALHYLMHGYKERRDPAPNFSTGLYLADHPDLDRVGIHALQHYVLWGHKERRRVQPAVKLPEPLTDSATDGRPAILIVLHGATDSARRFARDLSDQVARRLRPIVLTIISPGRAVLHSREMASPCEPFVLSQALNYLATESVRWDLKRIAVLHSGCAGDGSLQPLLERLALPFDVLHLHYGMACGNPALTDEQGHFIGDANLPEPTWRDDSEHRWLIEHAAEHFACSRSLAGRLTRFGIARDIVVAPAPDPFRIRAYRVWARPMHSDQPLRVALFGNLTAGEGREIVKEVLRRVAQRKLKLRFRLYSEEDPGLPSSKIFEVVRYRSLVEFVCSWHPHLAWYPSQTLDECGYKFDAAEAMGIPVAASLIGVAAERFASRPLSWLLPWNSDPDDWIELFTRLQQEGMTNAAKEDHMPEALPDDDAVYRQFYWRVAL